MSDAFISARCPAIGKLTPIAGKMSLLERVSRICIVQKSAFNARVSGSDFFVPITEQFYTRARICFISAWTSDSGQRSTLV
jgi:hypothetical protein